jgi:hypothetical protein
MEGMMSKIRDAAEVVVMLAACILAVALLILVLGIRGCCVQESKAVGAAEAMGYHNVNITNRWNFFAGFHGCDGYSDAAVFEFEALNPAGEPGVFLACCGWPFKGCTIRVP